jgi:hypothetical protein
MESSIFSKFNTFSFEQRWKCKSNKFGELNQVFSKICLFLDGLALKSPFKKSEN